MEKERKRWFKKGIKIIAGLSASLILSVGIFIFANSQKIDSNALITYGFFKKQVDQLTAYIDTKIKSLDDKINKAVSQPTSNSDLNKLKQDVDQLKQDVSLLKNQVSSLDQKITNLSKGTKVQSQKGFIFTKGYEIIKVSKGKTILFSASSEFILRTGRATSVVPKSASIIDLSVSKDIGNAQNIAANHLLLVVKDDGRGFRALEDVWVIVNGGYKIK